MLYSSAVVLSTLAIGSAAAAHSHNRHASFHARRQADSKRSADSGVDWANVAYDLKDVDWSKVNYGSPSAAATTPAAAQTTPAAAASPTAEQKKPEVKPAEVHVAAAPSPSASKPAEASKPQSVQDTVHNVVSDLMSGVESIANAVGAKVGKNDKSDNGGIWIGDDSAWKAVFTNDGNSDSVIYCWKANGFSGMSVNVNVPEVSVGLKSGESVTLSFAPNVPAACAPAYSSTKLALFGGWDQTWWEATFGQNGAFDVSRNVNMNGCNISSKGSKCTSDMDTCVFKCKNSGASSCEKGTDYDLFNCNASGGGGGGYDSVMAGTGGGCSMGANSETVHVNYS